MKIGVVTVSDRASRGEYDDLSGPAIEAWLKAAIVTPYETVRRVIPDGMESVRDTLIGLCDREHCDLILTTGGTGPSPRDETPEAMSAVMEKELPGFGELMRRQQQTMNDTFGLDQKMQRQFEQDGQSDEDQSGEGQSGDNPFPGGDGAQGGGQPGGNQPDSGQSRNQTPDQAEAMRKLQQQQEDLRSDLQKLMDSLKGMGIEPGKDFADAGKSMGGAADALGQGDPSQAGDNQGNALEALRRGGRDMMKKMQQAMGGQAQGQGGRDPLGRRQGTDGGLDDQVKIPGEIDIQRAREILDEIRRRLGNAVTPQIEKDYLQRLLQFDN